MKVSFPVLLALLLAANAAGAVGMGDWRSDVPCGRRLPVKEVKLPGCNKAVAAQLPGGVEFSVCRTPQSEQTAEMQVSLRRGGETIKS